MFLEALGWLLLLLFIGVITPGPNNITCTVHSALHGPKSNIPLIGGMAVGFFIVQFVCGLTVHYFSNESQIADILNIFWNLECAIRIWRFAFHDSRFGNLNLMFGL